MSCARDLPMQRSAGECRLFFYHLSIFYRWDFAFLISLNRKRWLFIYAFYAILINVSYLGTAFSILSIPFSDNFFATLRVGPHIKRSGRGGGVDGENTHDNAFNAGRDRLTLSSTQAGGPAVWR